MASARTPRHSGGAHEPVMLHRIVELLAVGEAVATGPVVLADCTVGAAGHAAGLLAASRPDTHLVAFDRDPDAIDLAARRLAAYAERLTLVHAGFETLTEHLEPVIERVGPLAGVLYDLGVSSMQFDTADRGFSFRADAPLDMRMDPNATSTAADLVNALDPADLAALLRRFGEERFARRIAQRIVESRPVRTTGQLAEIVVAAVPAAGRRAHTHPATRTFQALRIATNNELERFSASLPQALELAAPAPVQDADSSHSGLHRGGRVVVLAYHSLEDRIAKQTFVQAASGCACPPGLPVCVCGRRPAVRILTRGAVRPSTDEVVRNPRARSARLRAVERTHVAAGTGAPS